MSRPVTGALPAAVLVGVQLPGVTDEDVSSSLEELRQLSKTLGLRPVARVTQRRPSTGAPSLLGEGKLRELARLTGGTGVVPSGASHRQTGTKPREEATPPEDLGAIAGDEDAPVETGEAPSELASVVVVDHDLTPS